MIKKIGSTSLKLQLSLILLISTLSIWVLVLGSSISTTKDSTKDILIKQALFTLETLSQESVFPLLYNSAVDLDPVLNNISKAPDFSYAATYRDDHSLLASKGTPPINFNKKNLLTASLPANNPMEQKNHWVFIAPINYQHENTSQQLGFCVFVISKARYKKIKNEILINTLLPTLVTGTLIMWLMLNLLRKALIPLETLSQAMTQTITHTDSNNTAPPLTESGPIEIRHITATYNKMTHALRKTEYELVKTINNQENIIHEKTKQHIQAKDQAITANEQKTNVIKRISHDFRSPLQSIRISSQLLRDIKENQDSINIINSIDKSERYISTIIDNFNYFSELEKSQVSTQIAHFTLDALFQKARAICQPIAHEKDLSITFLNLSPDTLAHVLIETDLNLLQRILLNIIFNAIKYTDNGSINITARINDSQNDKTLRLCIKDTGVGITEKYQARIFEPYFHINTHNNVTGTGLGLSIVKQYINLLKGEISLISAPNQGSEFKFSIPIEYASNHISTHDFSSIDKPQPHDKPVNILIADDDESITAMLQLALDTMGYTTHTANNGTDAQQALFTSTYDIAILDNQMPQRSGPDIAASWKQQHNHHKTALILLTGDENSQENEFQLLFDEVLRKPYDIDNLIDIINKYTR